MNGISILLVDDDKLLVEKLAETVHWGEIGIAMVFTAFNIRQAREILQEYSIQILIADIDMPQGNGLELIEWIRNQQMDVECLILSSYANFAYAQMALKLASKEYLLKPISNANLEAVLRNVVSVVEEKMHREDQSGALQKQKVWEEFFRGGSEEEEQQVVKSLQQFYGNEDGLRLQLIHLWDDPSLSEYKRLMQQFDNALRNLAESVLTKEAAFHPEAIVRCNDAEWMLALREECSDIPEIKGFLQEWENHLHRLPMQMIAIYQGRLVTLDGITESRRRLEEMQRCSVIDKETILYESEWTPKVSVYRSPAWDTWELELNQSGKFELVKEQVLNFLEERQEEKAWRRDSLEQFVWEYQIFIQRYINSHGMKEEELFETSPFEYHRKLAQVSLAETRYLICYALEQLAGKQMVDAGQESVIQNLKNYIELHLGEDLSRTVLAKQVYLSADYISKLFAKSVGMSLPNYIAERRIAKAREYLKNSTLPVSKVAIEVGYSNFSYFSKTFREMTGCTPNEYRSKMQQNNKNLNK